MQSHQIGSSNFKRTYPYPVPFTTNTTIQPPQLESPSTPHKTFHLSTSPFLHPKIPHRTNPHIPRVRRSDLRNSGASPIKVYPQTLTPKHAVNPFRTCGEFTWLKSLGLKGRSGQYSPVSSELMSLEGLVKPSLMIMAVSSDQCYGTANRIDFLQCENSLMPC